MSKIPWTGLRDLDCVTLADLANAWESYARTGVECAQRLRDEVVDGHISADNYESDTAEQVREQVKLTANRWEDDLNDYAIIRLSATLLELSEALVAEQTELEELIGLIDAHNFTITGDPQDYQVELTDELRESIEGLDAPQWLKDRTGIYETMDAGAPSAANDLITELRVEADRVAGQYGDWLRAIMSRTHDADDAAVALLAAMRDDPPDLPPKFGETYDDLLEDYKQDLSNEVTEEMEAIATGESGLSPEQVNQWWEGLSDGERESLIATHPEWVGPTDGVPVANRDQANRTVLEDDLSEFDAQIADVEDQIAQIDETGVAPVSGETGLVAQDRYSQLQDELDALQDDRSELAGLYDRITDADGDPATFKDTGQEYYLLDFATEDSGQAIVAVGNPDTADNVNVYVPGTGADFESTYGGNLGRAETMADDARIASPGEETATVLWLGYDAPDSVVPEATETKWAEDGASDLESFTQGVRATAEGDPSNLTLTGHSYGTTMIGTAASSEGVEADNLVFVASPGVGTDTASALGVGEENVWATRNDKDIIQYGIVHGDDPLSDGFSGNTFHSDAVGTDPSANHSTYWDEGNRAGRDTMADIATGRAVPTR